MNLTQRLKDWAIENLGIEKDAEDDEFKKAVSNALFDGTLTTEKLVELSKDPDADKATELEKKFDRIANGLDKAITLMTPKEEKPEEKKEAKPEETKAVKPEPSKMAKMVARMGGTPTDLDGKDIDVRVKEAVESYSATKSAMLYPDRTKSGRVHALAGQRTTNQGRPMDIPSDCDKALSGVWAKYQLMSVTPRIAGSPQRAWEMLSDHEKSLLAHLTEKGEWDDSKDGRASTRIGYPGGIKALIDDSTSGGLEAAPIVFDDQVIAAPLLNGELYPLVNEIPLDRGRRIEGVSTGNITSSWGGVDDTAISLFNTASYVAAFDTTIYRWEGAVQIGLDFLSDTPIDFNAHITAQYGERLLEDLDDVIATGNGTTQPQGIMNATGTTSVAFGAAMSLSNLESLRFSVAKAEHGSFKNTAVFCGTETTYSRAIGVPVGGTDTRRVFGTMAGPNYDGYGILQRPFKINESLTNAQMFYAILGRYRMYRRKGLTVRTSTEGDTLVRQNEMLIVVMARYGGQLERGACAAVTTTAPA